jgi:hypothetical protein
MHFDIPERKPILNRPDCPDWGGELSGYSVARADRMALFAPTTACGEVLLGEEGTLCGGHTWPWAVRYLSVLDTLANSLWELWHRRPIDLNFDGLIFCGHPPLEGGSEARPRPSARLHLAGPCDQDNGYSDASTSGNGTPPAEHVESSVLAELLLARLAAAWNRLTQADRLAIVELAERFTLANRDGVTVDD